MIARVLVVDDEPLARERLVDLVRRAAPGAQIREAGDGDTAVDAIRGWTPDVVLLDVQMPGKNGFQVIEALPAGTMPATIFVTAYDQHAVRAFEVAAVDYLLKPFDDERFQAAWRRATTLIATGAVVAEARRLSGLVAAAEGRGAADPNLRRTGWIDRVVIRKDQRTFVVYLADVQWIESSGNYVVLHAGKEAHTLRESLVGLLSRLDPSRFVRIHRRIVVDVGALRELQPWFGGDQIMILKDGTKLRVSRSYRESLARSLAGGA
ncbi:MAG: LytTR family DNA-binding domain-containing protein [Gemmatimonadales bacterium]|nr:response regulator transcription factor [Gemmatimonadota bacterium]MDX2057011.1 LytTR family DNA-binding domain-containing protein [Gemmatimonadales bacterium]